MPVDVESAEARPSNESIVKVEGTIEVPTEGDEVSSNATGKGLGNPIHYVFIIYSSYRCPISYNYIISTTCDLYPT